MAHKKSVSQAEWSETITFTSPTTERLYNHYNSNIPYQWKPLDCSSNSQKWKTVHVQMHDSQARTQGGYHFYPKKGTQKAWSLYKVVPYKKQYS